ncbi:MAG: methyltransferase domain-containing protein [Bdellovibrionota bacterium]
MIDFDPNDPFPLLKTHGAKTYREEQAHSVEVDMWLGLETEAIEARLANQKSDDDRQLWIGHPVQAVHTPYTEFRFILNELALPAGSVIVDLGAGYGRLGFVVGRYAPELKFIGYEYVRERVEEFRRCAVRFQFTNVELIEADLASPSFHPAEADVYFLYDYGTRAAIKKTLVDLREISMRRDITVVGRGRASRDAIERGEPWLSQVVAPKHYDHFSFYRSS